MLKENFEFHNIIFKAAKAPRLEALVVQYFQMSDQYRALALELPGRYDEVCMEHREILEALKAGDPARAEQQEREHQFNTARRLAQSLGVEPTI
jgi:DNA-binding FadR family transcriptional regulator